MQGATLTASLQIHASASAARRSDLVAAFPRQCVSYRAEDDDEEIVAQNRRDRLFTSVGDI